MKTSEEFAYELAGGSRGGFAAKIGEAFQTADSDNRAKLIEAFPDLLKPKRLIQRISVTIKLSTHNRLNDIDWESVFNRVLGQHGQYAGHVIDLPREED